MDPLAYHLSWTTYGTWLHGDARGWVEAGEFGIRPADPDRYAQDRYRMTADTVVLDNAQRRLVARTVADHCRIRGWALHAVNARTNHVHLVVTAGVAPDEVMRQLKAWCARRLSEQAGLSGAAGKQGKKRWWTEHGSTKWINDETYFQNAVNYVTDGQ